MTIKYVLRHPDEESITLTNEQCPAGIDGFTLRITRSKIYYSTLRAFTISEKFHGDGKIWIDRLFAKYGWDIKLSIDVSMFDENAYEWLPIIVNGTCDIKNYIKSELYTELSIQDGSIQNIIMDNEDAEIDINRSVDIYGNEINAALTPVVPFIFKGSSGNTTLNGYIYWQAIEKCLRIITGKENPINHNLSTLKTGDISTKILTNGKLIRGYNYDIEFPVNLRDMFMSLSAQRCLGMGFDNDKVYITELDSFYPQTLICELEQPWDLEIEYESDILYNSVEIGYKNFEKEENAINGQSEYNKKSTYSIPIRYFKSKKTLLSPYRADGTTIENLIELGFDDKTNKLDNEKFIINCFINDDDLLESQGNENYDIITGIYNEFPLYINLDDTPANMLYRWGKWINAGYNHLKDKQFIIQGVDTLSKLSTLKTGESTTISNGIDIQQNDIERSVFTGRKIKFNCNFTARKIYEIINNPLGIVKVKNYIENKYSYGYIDSLSLKIIGGEHQVELLEIGDVDIENVGYLINEDGTPITLENGSLIKLEINMPQIPTKISQLTEIMAMPDDAYAIVALGGSNYSISGANLKGSIISETQTELNTIFAANQENIINLGSYLEAKTIYVNYTATRSTRFRAGIFVIKAVDAGNASIAETGAIIIPNDFGENGGFANIDADVSGNQVRLKITTDNLDSEITDFSYILTKLSK